MGEESELKNLKNLNTTKCAEKRSKGFGSLRSYPKKTQKTSESTNAPHHFHCMLGKTARICLISFGLVFLSLVLVEIGGNEKMLTHQLWKTILM